MSFLRSSLMVAALGLTMVGCSSTSTNGSGVNNGTNRALKTPDEQFADIKLQYDNLTAADKKGEKGQKLIADLKAIKGELSEKAAEGAAQLTTVHNLRQIEFGQHKYDGDPNGGPKFPPILGEINRPDIDLGKIDPNGIKFPDRGKLPIDPTKPPFDPGKLPFDPTRIPDLKFPLDPTKIPDLKFPTPPSFPDLKLPDIKFPDLPKFPNEKSPPLPPPREKPGS